MERYRGLKSRVGRTKRSVKPAQHGSAKPAPLKGMFALATGASSGIGRAISLALADAGASVFLSGRNMENLESAGCDARKNAADVWICPADLCLETDIRKLTETIAREAGRLDVLIVCAGIHRKGKIAESTPEDMDELYRSNVRAPFLLIQSMLPMLRAANGQIVFVNSSAGLQGRANAGQFSATQHALRAMADALREEVNADGIRVLNVFPGRTATPRMKAMYAADGKAYEPDALMQPENVATMVVQALCLPRAAEVTEIHMRPMRKSY